ncbi:helicase-related protein [Miltoncostaea marina]|uniref:helicase-related protein n=1 Tax=Miltoncostaea marina TaxID=2843215 RepID=UPI001C3E0CAC|nr:helicase-related protein [Miltoncostaea marina]
MTPRGAFRNDLLDHLRAYVVGPHDGEDEEIRQLPYRRYLSGTLYPKGADADALLADEVQDASGGSVGEDRADDPVTLANEWLPSSIGLSFRLEGEPRVAVALWAAVYDGAGTRFRRRALASRDRPETHLVVATEDVRHHTDVPVLDDRGLVRCLWRPLPGGWLVTVTLVNSAQAPTDEPGSRPDPEACLYQVGFECTAPGGRFVDYPSIDKLVADDEDEELALVYRRARQFAIGHGTSAEWSEPTPEPDRVRTETVPSFELAAITPRWEKTPEVLSLDHLADADRDELRAGLEEFVEGYEEWIGGLPGQHGDLPTRLHPARDRILTRLRDAATRMRRGIAALDDDDVLLAFRLANRAMAMQMRHSESDLGGSRKRRADAPGARDVAWVGRDYGWFPFQLAFQLLVLPGLVDPSDEDREVVDLLWFPTGGGKTEAYLAVAATEILLRRLRSGPRGGGTAVITRYTLRLLTAQQFQRAAALVCALESLRGAHEERMGREPIRIGLWVGKEVTPNTFAAALQAVEDILEAREPVNVFQVERCPWCGTEIVPDGQSDNRSDYGLQAGSDFFRFNCPNERCAFHAELPIAVVDDEVYARPPTLLVGTVDKFAQLAWHEEAGAFFGSDHHAPPSLIIQDELHLLSGPLGTMVGLYERAIEALVNLRGHRPKVIASTATIRRADEQVRRLFGSPVKLFPPSGLDSEHSYFARPDQTAPGRLYVGVMSQSHTAATTNVQTSTALLLAPQELTLTEAERDGLWTLVAYHNTLKELGRALTQYRDDIPQMLKDRARDQSRSRTLGDEAVIELTGNVGGERLPSLLERLFLRADDRNAVSVLVTTSMLSVGVDVSRLALMLVNGQPKTTAEYIQATSRVGRSAVPGTVVTMYSATKPRDRSHYEGFRQFHEALYKQVEPTSVTPFSLPARARALHAALVVLVRHGAGLPSNADAMRMDPADPDVVRAVQTLKDRIAESDPREAEATTAEIDALLHDWKARAEACRDDGTTLFYFFPSRQHPSLLINFAERRPGWETPQSMRSVDHQVAVDVVGGTS